MPATVLLQNEPSRDCPSPTSPPTHGASMGKGSIEAERYKRQGEFRHSALSSHAHAWTVEAPRALAIV